MNEDQQVPSDHDLPLSGVRVVDLSRLVSGNILTHVLADLGADVLKVEPPGRGDELRAWRRKGVSTYWLAYSRNKQSVTLDLRSEDGFAELRGLLAEADVLVENFRPGTLERMSLTREALQEINPRLVVARISGWGQTGCFSNKGGFGTLIEAMSGFASMNGYADRPPVVPAFAMADSVAGIYGAAVVLASLHKQRASDKVEVQEIDLSLFEPLFSILGPQAAEYQLTGEVVPRCGSRSPTHAPRNVYRTKDNRWVALSAAMEGPLKRLFKAIGFEAGTEDPRFASHEARLANIDALDGLIQDHLAELTLEDALEFFAEHDITAGPVCDIKDLLEHPYIVERGLLVNTASPEGKDLLIHAPPYKINGKRPPIRCAAPEMGQDNARWLSSHRSNA
ncbi:CaiB/BaiF CoA transferase family protein [Variovorax sp. RA8]|uniref:CaiB/BaiF CoA transferase family protein n=1 Tax=Variovorax sp. (strain JCM 16519 / RA8) TaxID=662548 RepID=UPI0013A55E34|nr:CoA transferase [Variovorax sp. RA8]